MPRVLAGAVVEGIVGIVVLLPVVCVHVAPDVEPTLDPNWLAAPTPPELKIPGALDRPALMGAPMPEHVVPTGPALVPGVASAVAPIEAPGVPTGGAVLIPSGEVPLMPSGEPAPAPGTVICAYPEAELSSIAVVATSKARVIAGPWC